MVFAKRSIMGKMPMSRFGSKGMAVIIGPFFWMIFQTRLFLNEIRTYSRWGMIDSIASIVMKHHPPSPKEYLLVLNINF